MSEARLELAIQNVARDIDAPSTDFIERCARVAMAGVAGELTIRIVDEDESANLNLRYRGKTGATNVLAFPAGETGLPDRMLQPLGDIAICGSVVAQEALDQGKPLRAHWAHIVIHGCLHLCGYDHEAHEDAEKMEAMERELLAEFSIPDPYSGES